MEKPKFESSIWHGVVNRVDNNLINIIRLYVDKESTLSMDDAVLPNIEGKYSNLKEGQQVVVMEYSYTNLNGTKRTEVDICDATKYNCAVRESQQLPNGWICMPRFNVSEIRGIVTIVYSEEKKVEFVDDSGRIYILEYDELDCSKYYAGQRVIINATYKHTKSDGKIDTEYLMVPCDEKAYDRDGTIISSPIPFGGRFTATADEEGIIRIQYSLLKASKKLIDYMKALTTVSRNSFANSKLINKVINSRIAQALGMNSSKIVYIEPVINTYKSSKKI